ncbi:TIGR00297 family protein [Synechocystis sp. FACHB-383]|uniref:TIGR00297 family protein n=1 Tax=Synechocystis sp. FACHB-383 TaxID=2692864 RepID=UPI00168912AC|nr:TIGR00297 family protein [Synechocystis sp. FACHB-383]MBD2654363.1 TIGR00297 family protein [Synechocystis sp. FACHB-383]
MDNSLISEVWRQSLAFPWLTGIVLNSLLLAFAAIAPKKLLTAAGYGHAWVLGVIIWAALGWQGYLVVLAYFLVGSAVTRIGQAEKEAAGIAEKRSGQRGPENVWGSALTAAFCALAIAFGPQEWQPWLALGYVASFSTKLSDTTASEVGKAYGKSTFLITTLQPVPRGTEGAVSVEGTVAGFVAGSALAFLGYGLGLITLGGVMFSTLAAFGATNLESVIGATLQNKWPWLTNEVVNGINTFLGAAIAIGMAATAQLI